jgi:hypothetical protein
MGYWRQGAARASGWGLREGAPALCYGVGNATASAHPSHSA